MNSNAYILVVGSKRLRVRLSRTFAVGDPFSVDGKKHTVSRVSPGAVPEVHLEETCKGN